jgi:Flp pilus assembly pilin Flp
MRRLFAEEAAATSAEYAFIMALLIIAAITTLAYFGTHVGDVTTCISTDVPGASAAPGDLVGSGSGHTRTKVLNP